MAEKTNTMASHRMTLVSEKPISRGASIRTLPEMLPTIMPSGRASRMAMIQLSTPITIPSKMKILCTAPGKAPALCLRNGPMPPYIIQTSWERRNMPGGPKHQSPTSHPEPAGSNEKRLPTPIPQGACGAVREEAPGQSEGERGRQESRQMRFRGYGVCVATEDEEVGWIWYEVLTNLYS